MVHIVGQAIKIRGRTLRQRPHDEQGPCWQFGGVCSDESPEATLHLVAHHRLAHRLGHNKANESRIIRLSLLQMHHQGATAGALPSTDSRGEERALSETVLGR